MKITPTLVVNELPLVTRMAIVEPIEVTADSALDQPDPGNDFDDAPTPVVGAVFDSLLPTRARTSDPAAAANDSEIVNSDFMRSRGHDEKTSKLRQVMAVRLVRARRLSGMSQGDVARAMGAKGQTQQNLFEQGRRLVPMADLVRLAEVLSVSTDYLLGVNDEPERDPSAGLRHAILRGVRSQLQRVAEITVDVIASHEKLIGPRAGKERALLTAGDDLLEAFASFVRANSTVFADQRGSARLERCAHEFEASVKEARDALRRHDDRDASLRRALADIAHEE